MASVLIIDAEEEFANQLADALRDEGVEPSVTGDGKVGLDLARINVPAAIVLCVELPRMSGYSICAKLKKDASLKNVPLIITSAEATPETFEHHKKLKTRAEEYLKKPFPASLLVDVLRGYMTFGDARAPADEPISEELSIEDQPPATLTDDEAFSAEEASSMDGGNGRPPQSEEMAAIDGLLNDLTRPPPLPSTRAALSTTAGMQAVSAPKHQEFDESEDEAMTTVGFMPPPVSNDHLHREIEELKDQLREAKEAVLKAERDKALAQANEKAASSAMTASQVPSASSAREVVALKKELNSRERDLLELREKVTSKERENLALKDRETELEGQVVQLDEERAAADAARGAAEERARISEAAAQAADSRASAADAARASAESAKAAAEQRASQADARAAAADRKAQASETARVAAEQKAAAADSARATAETRAHATETKHAELQKASETAIADLERRLGEASAHEAELDGVLQMVTQEANQLRETLAETEQQLASAQEHLETLRGANQTQNQEITRLTNELGAAAAEAETLRQQLSLSQASVEEEQGRVAALDTELATARGEIDGLRTTLQELENEREVNEGRIARAYQKIRDDEKIKGKARKAIEIALALLQEAGYTPEAESAPPAEAAEAVETEARS